MLLKLDETLTIPHVARQRMALLQALEESKQVELDTGAVSEVDVAGLQLLCSAHRSAVERGRAICFAGGTPSPTIEDAATAAGLSRVKGCAGGCLWKETRDG